MQRGYLSVSIYRDHKVRQLAHSEQLLFTKLILWCVEHETDGYLPADLPNEVTYGHRGVSITVERMLSTGLLTTPDRSVGNSTAIAQQYYIHNYDRWQAQSRARYPKGPGHPSGVTQPSRTHAPTQATDLPSLDISTDPLSNAHPPMRQLLDGVMHRYVQGDKYTAGHWEPEGA